MYRALTLLAPRYTRLRASKSASYQCYSSSVDSEGSAEKNDALKTSTVSNQNNSLQDNHSESPHLDFEDESELADLIQDQKCDGAWNQFMKLTENSSNTLDQKETVMPLLRLICNHGVKSLETRRRISYLLDSLHGQELVLSDQCRVMLTLLDFGYLVQAREWFDTSITLNKWNQLKIDEQSKHLRRKVESVWIERLISIQQMDEAMAIFRWSKQRKEKTSVELHTGFIRGFLKAYSVDPKQEYLEKALKFMEAQQPQNSFAVSQELPRLVTATFQCIASQLQNAGLSPLLLMAFKDLPQYKRDDKVEHIRAELYKVEQFVRLAHSTNTVTPHKHLLLDKADDELKLYESDLASLKVNKHICLQFIHGYALLGLTDDAQRWFDEWRQLPVDANHERMKSKAWGFMMWAKVRNVALDEKDRLLQCRKFFDVMASEGLQSTEAMNCLLHSFAKSESLMKLKDSLQLVEEMQLKYSIPLDLYSYSILIDCCVRTMDDIKSVERLRYKFGPLTRETSYEASGSAMNEQQLDQLSLYELFVKTRNPFTVLQRLLDSLQSQGIAPNTITLTSVIQGYLRHEKKIDALQLYNNMKEQGMPIDILLASSLLKAMCRDQNYSAAVEFFKDVNSKSVRGDSNIRANISRDLQLTSDGYAGLIFAFGQMGDIEQAEQLFMEMGNQSGQTRRNINCYNALLKAYCKYAEMGTDQEDVDVEGEDSAMQKALKCLALLKQENAEQQALLASQDFNQSLIGMQLHPTFYTYKNLMQIASLSHKYDVVLKFLQLLIKDEGVQFIDDRTLSHCFKCLDGRYHVDQNPIRRSGCDLNTISMTLNALFNHPLASVNDVVRQSSPSELKRSLYKFRYHRSHKIYIGPLTLLTCMQIYKDRLDFVGMKQLIQNVIKYKIKMGEPYCRDLIDLFDTSVEFKYERGGDLSDLNQDSKILNEYEQRVQEFNEKLVNEWPKVEASLPADYYQILSQPPDVLPSIDELFN
ncbi:hypothetical protein MIR68_005860 [Amoeboaphelidium protococcarum]|nr:hypothetical protein MIR68_005860 [Amoeboaphelidium protococcarum]